MGRLETDQKLEFQCISPEPCGYLAGLVACPIDYRGKATLPPIILKTSTREDIRALDGRISDVSQHRDESSEINATLATPAIWTAINSFIRQHALSTPFGDSDISFYDLDDDDITKLTNELDKAIKAYNGEGPEKANQLVTELINRLVSTHFIRPPVLAFTGRSLVSVQTSTGKLVEKPFDLMIAFLRIWREICALMIAHIGPYPTMIIMPLLTVFVYLEFVRAVCIVYTTWVLPSIESYNF